jgi:hypothetical protein
VGRIGLDGLGGIVELGRGLISFGGGLDIEAEVADVSGEIMV